jgi:hypothetical protein
LSPVVLLVVLVLLLVGWSAVIGGVGFTPFLLGLILLALVGVLDRFKDRGVRKPEAVLDPGKSTRRRSRTGGGNP